MLKQLVAQPIGRLLNFRHWTQLLNPSELNLRPESAALLNPLNRNRQMNRDFEHTLFRLSGMTCPKNFQAAKVNSYFQVKKENSKLIFN